MQPPTKLDTDFFGWARANASQGNDVIQSIILTLGTLSTLEWGRMMTA